MTNIEIGACALLVCILLIGFKMHIGLALGLSALGGLVAIIGTRGAFGVVMSAPFEFAANWELSAVPMFVLMGAVAYHTGMTNSLFHAARLWLSRLPGGLAISANFACAGFAAASGSSLATTISMGKIAIPEMRKYRYDPGLAGGVVAAAGTLGSLIPPSILLVIYGIFAEVSIIRLFTAAIIPGILTAMIYAIMIYLRARHNPALAPPPDDNPTMSEKMRALLDIWPLPLLVVAVLGSLYSGLATATEAGALGATMAMAIAAAQGRLTWANLVESLRDSVMNTATLFFIAIGAVLMTRLMGFSGLPNFLAGLLQDWPPLTLLLLACLVFLVLGCVIDPMGMILLTLPVMIPLFKGAGFDMIWFGILVVKFVELGLVTPPLGLNVYAVRALAPDIPLGTLFKGVSWFILCELIVVALLILYPGMTSLLY
jgi:C4-dicarboxylate transporter DctM subunit